MRKCTNCGELLPLKTMGITEPKILIEHSSMKRPLLKQYYKATYTCTKCNQLSTFDVGYQTDPLELAIAHEYIKNKMKAGI